MCLKQPEGCAWEDLPRVPTTRSWRTCVCEMREGCMGRRVVWGMVAGNAGSWQVPEGPKRISSGPSVSVWRALATSFSFPGSFLRGAGWSGAHLAEHSQWDLLACVATWWPLSHLAAVMRAPPGGNLGEADSLKEGDGGREVC